MIITVLLLTLIALAVLNDAIRSAATGYEDEFGFHEELHPQGSENFGVERQAAMIAEGSHTEKSEAFARKLRKRLARSTVSHGHGTEPTSAF